MNEITTTIRGRLGSDVSLTCKPGSKPFAMMRVACTARYRDKEGNWYDGNTEWVSVKAFGNLAENMRNSLAKGHPVIATGTIRTEKWTDREGKDRFSFSMLAESVGHDLVWGRSAYRSNSEDRLQAQNTLDQNANKAWEASTGENNQADLGNDSQSDSAENPEADPWTNAEASESENEEETTGVDLKSRGYELVSS